MTAEQQLAVYMPSEWTLVKNEVYHNGRTYVSRFGLRARFIGGRWGEMDAELFKKIDEAFLNPGDHEIDRAG